MTSEISGRSDPANLLRAELRVRAEAWARSAGVPYYKSLGKTPTILFEPTGDLSQHGNFHPLSWQAIKDSPAWAKRLQKRHTQVNTLPLEKRATARELDSSNSSDALLMNCFCFPGAAEAILSALTLPMTSSADFGYHPRLRLVDGGEDATEVDMRVGALLVEAKLTERTFTTSPKTHVSRYRDFVGVFDVAALSGDESHFFNYQLIRNALAAAQDEAHFLVLIDARRSDLRREWDVVYGAIRDRGLASRCGLRTWQQVAAAAPRELAVFLEQKYGILAQP